MGYKKYAHTQGYVMLRFFNTNQKNAIKRLEEFLNLRKRNQQNQSVVVKKILSDVKKRGDEAVIKYEVKF